MESLDPKLNYQKPGEEPYIFVSYAHKDRERVFPIINMFNQEGFRYWCDSGIDYMDSWHSVIAEKVKNCSVFLCVLTMNSAVSKICQREIYLADKYNKVFINVYLDEPNTMTIPDGIKMIITSTSYFIRNRFPTDVDFLKEICKAECIQYCRKLTIPPVLLKPDTSSSISPDTSSSYEKKRIKLDLKRNYQCPGEKPFIFISYAHTDRQQVLPIIEQLDKEGFRRWYDSGIGYSKDWHDVIAERVKKCSVLLSIMTKKSAASKNCRREIYLADKYNKDLFFVFLDEPDSMELPGGVEMILTSAQYLNRNDLNRCQTDEEFLKEICEADCVLKCRITEEDATVS